MLNHCQSEILFLQRFNSIETIDSHVIFYVDVECIVVVPLS